MRLQKFIFFWALAVLVLAFFAGCSDDDDDGLTTPPPSGVTETIGSSGGNIEISGEASLTIPADALDSDVDFTMDDAGSNHAAMVSARTLGSAVYSIGPSGTTFNEPVLLALNYSEDDLNGVAESSIIIYTDNGSGWAALPTTVDEDANIATAEITHLSDFAVTTPAGEPADGVFGLFEVVRLVSYAGEGVDINRADMIVARFDGVVNVCSPVEPMHPDSVYCNSFGMSYDELIRAYLDENTGGFDFLDLGGIYTFHVLASDEVPALEESITMVDHEPVITNIQSGGAVSDQGFTVEWNDTSTDSVTVALALCGEIIVNERVLNSGSFTFTADDLAGLNPGAYILRLFHYNRIMLDDVPGYDPNSYVIAMTDDTKLIYLSNQSGLIGPDGGTVLLGDDGHLTIPAGALDENILFEAEISSPPPTAPEDYTLLTPIYSIEPSGTAFDPEATLRFNYLETALGDALEEDIVVLTNSSGSWEELGSLVYEDQNYVEAGVSHLSDFVAAVPTPIVTDGVYAVLDVQRQFVNNGGGDIGKVDILFARFDAVVSDEPDTPLQAESVTFGPWELVWNEDSYSYTDYIDTEFLTPGETYDFEVVGNTAVPSLETPIEIMGIEPYVTNLEPMQDVLLSGFTLEWNESSAASTVNIVVFGYGGHGLSIDVPDTGSYTFTVTELSEIEPGMAQIALFWEEEVPIVADDYDSHSYVLLNTFNSNHVIFSDDVVIQQVTYTEVPHLAIPDAVVDAPGTPVTDVINVMETGVVDSIRVYLDIDHDYSSDLTLKLMSPDGTELRVFWIGEGGEPNVDPVGWYPDDFTPKDDLNGFDGESINGEWTITAQDMSYEQAGELTEWRLQLFYVE